jgi:signal transduction histidine kinase
MKKKLYTFIFLLFISTIIPNILNAQSVIDSLENELKKNSIDTIKLEILINLCEETMFSDTSKSNIYQNQIIKITNTTSNVFYKAEAYYTLARLNAEQAKYEIAIKYFNSANSLFKSLKNSRGETGCARVLINFGRIYNRFGDFETSLNMYLEAEKILDKYKNYNKLVNLYSNLSNLFFKLQQPQKSKIYANKTISLVDKVSGAKFKSACYNTYASSLLVEGQYADAEKYLKKAIQIAKDDHVPDILFNCYYNMAYMYYDQEKYSEELVFNKKLLELTKISNNQSDKCEALFKLGSCYYHLKNYTKANEFLYPAYQLAIKLNSKVLQSEILEILASLEYKKSNYKKGFELIEKNLALTYEINSEESQQNINFLDARFQSQKRENEIKQLQYNQKIKDLIISKRQQWIYGLLSIITFILIIAFFLIINYHNKRKITKQEIVLKEQRIQQLEKDKQIIASHAVIVGEEIERTRLARDLHDGLGGLLSGVKLKLSSLKGNYITSQTSVEQFDLAVNLLDNSIKELRRVAHNMMPEALVKFGLKDALQDFCERISTGKELKLSFQFFGDNNRFHQPLETTVYRIAQELINNALKHANASEIMVQLMQDNNRLHLTVQDNGIGFDHQKVDIQKSSGLQNLKARAESFNGTLEISSKQGEGTEISVEFYIKS